MSFLQQFPSQSEPPVRPHATAPSATSLRQQSIKQIGVPTRTAVLWLSLLVGSAPRSGVEELFGPFLGEQVQAFGSSKEPEYAHELVHGPSAESCQSSRNDSTLSALERIYVLEDRSAIPAFVRPNRLLELLLEAPEPLASAFGEATVKKLSLTEDDEGSVTLFCLMLTPGSSDEARRALNSFDDSWWLAHSHEAEGKLNFDFELI